MHTTTLSTAANGAIITDHRHQFLTDVIEGLSSSPKCLHSKYFYDEQGDKLFQQIMQCPEYYPTRCEMEIIRQQREEIIGSVLKYLPQFDVVELGAGDASKSIHLLQTVCNTLPDFTYYPIDISWNIIQDLEKRLPEALPGLRIHGLHGEYLEMLQQTTELSHRNKLVLFMGGNIGNFDARTAVNFCRELRRTMRPGDLLLIGFDLKKHPQVILDAYNDKQGLTRDFNINLLHRINRELDADFDPMLFHHYPTYDPATGACKSYLVSLEKQKVCIGKEATITFEKDECIFMEVAQKYSPEEIQRLAFTAGFSPVGSFVDASGCFADCLWRG
ncbi:L-histidine N(alpha)-methyltransferase [Filimonas effusa]|uniref:L-histidine N(Alpha)-methyltransferase n=1 Tax=Filimonas effusa TaxID=2508721 RepID=A0A4Q1DC02_9BACT|nr:L-histidine N(alpha)-methyltransferase [Filimonas effusa]RXK86133.1 L-histidine N(alpha)-methyltransferase [Filimonas effusa]